MNQPRKLYALLQWRLRKGQRKAEAADAEIGASAFTVERDRKTQRVKEKWYG